MREKAHPRILHFTDSDGDESVEGSVRVSGVASTRFQQGVYVTYESPEALRGIEEITFYARCSRDEFTEWTVERDFPVFFSKGKWRSTRSEIDKWYKQQRGGAEKTQST